MILIKSAGGSVAQTSHGAPCSNISMGSGPRIHPGELRRASEVRPPGAHRGGTPTGSLPRASISIRANSASSESGGASTIGQLAARATPAEISAAISQIGLAKNLKHFGIKLRYQRAQVASGAQLDATAQMINDLRHNPLADGADATTSYAELVAKCTPEAVAHYKKNVLVLTDAEDSAKTAITKIGGYAIPTSGSIIQTILYLALPIGGLYMAKGWAAYAGLGLSGGVLLAQPFVTAPLQTMFVSAINLFRQKGAPVTKLAGNIKANETLPQIEAKLQKLGADAQAEKARLAGVMDNLRAKYPAILPSSGELTEQKFKDLLQALTPDERTEQKEIDARMNKCSSDTMEALVKGQMLELMQLRQKDSTRAQEWPRILRALWPAIAGALLPLANHPMISGVDGHGKPNQKIPPGAIVGVSSFLALAALAAQHYAAGVDEVTAEDLEVKLNMLMGDFLNDQGKSDWAAGRQITAAGIDGGKVLAAKGLPETTIVGRVKYFAEAHLNTLAAKRANDQLLDTDSAYNLDLEARAPHKQDAEIALETRAIAILDSGDLEALNHPDFAKSNTKKLLDEAMGGYVGPSVAFAMREGWAKVPSDFGPQSAQRSGQNFMLGGLGGGAGAVLETRGVNAVMLAVVNKVTDGGGLQAAHPAIPATIGLVAAVLAATTAGISAKNQHSAATAKNIRRDNPASGVTWLGQVWDGIKGPFFQSEQNKAGRNLRPVGETALDVAWRGPQASNLRAAVEELAPKNAGAVGVE